VLLRRKHRASSRTVGEQCGLLQRIADRASPNCVLWCCQQALQRRTSEQKLHAAVKKAGVAQVDKAHNAAAGSGAGSGGCAGGAAAAAVTVPQLR
jgi:hypothetical protein